MPPAADPSRPAVRAPRTVLVTGQGGAGRTTVAAATALAAATASPGGRTLLLSAAGPGTLEAVLGVPLRRTPGGGGPGAGFEGGSGGGSEGGSGGGSEGVPVAPGLRAVRIDAGAEFRARAVALQEGARGALDMLGATPLDEDELTELPGSDAFALLHALRGAHAATPPWGTVVVDLPPVRHALGTLALPEQLRRYLRRLLPPERQAARALRPLLGRLAGVPVPDEWLYGTAARWERELADVQAVVESPRTAVRLVAEPGPAGAAQLRTARAALSLYGLRLEAVVANKLLPTGSADAWLASLSGQQQAQLKELREECAAAGTHLCELPHLGRVPQGTEDLAELAEALPERDGAERDGAERDGAERDGAERQDPPGRDRQGRGGAAWDGAVEDRLAEDGLLVWHIPLPGARKEQLGLVRRGDELVVDVGPYRRALPLPSALRRCRVTGAALDRGELRVRCAPDPALWPSGRGD